MARSAPGIARRAGRHQRRRREEARGLRARRSCACSPRPDSRRGDSPRRPVSSVQAIHAADCPPAMARSDDTPDDALMSAYARGDAAAFEQLYARHQAGLYRFIRRLLGPALAAQTDEVFQDTWLKVVHARERWAPQGATFRTWLFTLAHHRVIDLLRKSGREVALDAFEGEATSPGSPTPRPGSTGPRPPVPRRKARTWRSGDAPASSCCSAWSSCRWRSAAPSCCITTTACRSTRSRGRSRSASRPRRRGCAMR